MEAAVIYNRLHGDLKVPFTFRVPDRGDQETEADGGRPRSGGTAAAGRLGTDGQRDTRARKPPGGRTATATPALDTTADNGR